MEKEERGMEKKEGREREGENCFKPLEPMKPLVIEKKKVLQIFLKRNPLIQCKMKNIH